MKQRKRSLNSKIGQGNSPNQRSQNLINNGKCREKGWKDMQKPDHAVL